MKDEIFRQLYRRLNVEQKKAVDTIEGPVMVIAGPGTGKTAVLTLRIANILRKTDIPPEAILALTFTEAAAMAIKKRLADIIGIAAYSVAVKTFHGFSNDIIKTHREDFIGITGSDNISDAEQIQLVLNIIRQSSLKELKPFGDNEYYLKPIVKDISDLKREGISPGQFGDIVKKELVRFGKTKDLRHKKGAYRGQIKGVYKKRLRMLKKNEELAAIYQKYQEALLNMRRYDYNDMIIEVLGVLKKNGDLLADLREQYQYILIDEHQDTNNSQNRIVELIAGYHKNPNVFMVGDERQAIFRFQGASLENFSYFRKIYPDAAIITMTDNYRSTQVILDGADSIINADKKLKARIKSGAEKINIAIFSRPEEEPYFVGFDIEAKIKSGTSPQEIAILCRDNGDIASFIGDLDKRGIPFYVESDEDVLTDLLIRKIVLILRAIDKFGDQELFIRCLHIGFLGINPLDVYRLIEAADKNKISVFSIVKDLAQMKKTKFDSAKNIYEFYCKMTQWAVQCRNSRFLELLESVIYNSGVMDYALKQPANTDQLAKISSFFRKARIMAEKHRDYQLRDFIGYLDILEKYGIRLKKETLFGQGNRVRLMTAHKAKGLEFDYVYIVNATDGHWGSRRYHDSLPLLSTVYSLSGKTVAEKSTDDDERRLFYVAITRARKGVTISYSREGKDGREKLGSRFVEEIRPELINQLETVPIEAQMAIGRHPSPAIRANNDNFNHYRDFTAKLFKERGLAVTSLNNYLECPWRYFYLNLLRIPRAKSKHQLFGTAIHQALKEYFEEIKKGNDCKKYLIDRFVYQLKRQPLSENEYREALIKGKNALSGYYRANYQKWNPNAIAELNIDNIYLSPDLKITGKIDRLEIIDKLGHVNVVDYKTGKPKSRGKIEGSTKNSKGNIKRQLVFYRLLLDNFLNGRYHMASGEIDFIEPDARGKYVKEQFVILDEEVAALKELVIKTANEIIALDFWDKKCEDKDCEFCRLREIMG